jgi:hypothetical protein
MTWPWQPWMHLCKLVMLTDIKLLLLGLLMLVLHAKAFSEPMIVGVRGHQVQQELFSIFAGPGETVRLDLSNYDTSKVQVYLDGVAYGKPLVNAWGFAAPKQPGLYELKLAHLETHARSTFNLFVGVPRRRMSGEFLNQYRIGPPPPGNSKLPAYYAAPGVFFEVTPDNINTRLSEHFTLSQFLCKQQSGYPKYVVIQESLLVLLEGLIGEFQASGYPVETLGIISGYRTPYYNKKIGNVANSRHVYGDAMDFFIDLDEDGRMDDIDGDGTHNRGDIDRLFQIVEGFKRKPENSALVGGVGRYYPASHHGGFIHVDTRGYKARW